MSMIGIGAMIHELSGGSQESAAHFKGRTITSAKLEKNVLTLHFADGTGLRLSDNGQSCCEARYIDTDDDVASLVGGVLHSIKVEKTEEKVGEYGDAHEIAFVKVQTDQTGITLCTHVEHNGYYGGFGLNLAEFQQ